MLSPLKRLVMAVLAISLIAGLAGGSPAAHAEPAEAGARFTLGILPDTQFYSRYATQGQGDLFMERYGSNPFASQTQFWADHAEDYNTQMVLHLGDVVDRGRNWRTECDTPATGGNGCRTYAEVTVYQASPKTAGGYEFSQRNQFVFNNIVMFR